MKKTKSFFKNYKVEIFSFLFPVFIFCLACIFSKIYPFGQNYLATYDGGVQYGGFTVYLSKVLKGTESLFYSFKGGLGYNFYATAAYYLFNPTNILSIFFNETNIMDFYTLIVFLRIGLCGLTMSKYLKYKEKKGIWTIVFSIAYALVSYNTLYFYNFMYFDTVVLLPLVILGLDKLIHTGKCKTYIIFLSLSIISNFYIGYMVCIFCLLYFIYQYIIINKSKRKGLIKNFVISSILCGLISMVVLLPVFFELMNGKAQMYKENYTVFNKFGADGLVSFYRLSIGSYKTGDQINGYPNIYSSLLVLVLTILFFFNKSISKKEKIVTSIFLAFLLLCFSYNLLDYAWQFFQKPIWYPNRYSFVFSFLLITIAYKSFCNIDEVKTNNYLIISLSLILILFVIGGALYTEAFNDKGKIIFLALSVICILEYFLIIKNYKLVFFIISIFLIEISANTISNLKEISYGKQVKDYSLTYEAIKTPIKEIQDIENKENNFYRMESVPWLNLNNASYYNYNGMAYFNSLRNGKVMKFLESYASYTVKDGCSTRFNMYNPVYSSLLGFKYMISGGKYSSYEKIVENQSKNSAYINEEALPLGFMVNSNIKNVDLKVNESINNSNKIMSSSLGISDSFIKTISYNDMKDYWEEVDDGIKYVYYNSKDGGYILYTYTADKDYYLIINNSMRGANSVYLEINEDSYTNVGSDYISAIKLNKNDNYQLKIYFSTVRLKESELEMYLLDYDAYINWINEMKENSMEIIKYDKDDYIKASVNVTDDKTILLTTIPYDKGWNVFVDGKKYKYDITLDTFIGLELTKGSHTIEFKYIPRGFIIGSIISIIGILGSIIFIKKNKAN